MSNTLEPAIPYVVEFLPAATQRINELRAEAALAGETKELESALLGISRRLRWYPEFGKPLRDLLIPGARIWSGVVEGLVLRYAVYPNEKLVVVANVTGRLRSGGATLPVVD